MTIDNTTTNNTCSLYLAPSSTLTPHAGAGIYTIKPYPRGHTIRSNTPIIKIIDLLFHQKNDIIPDWRLSDYWMSFKADVSSEADSVLDWIPHGLGSLANYHTALHNVQLVGGGDGYHYYDDTMLNRFEDMNAGAFSYYTPDGVEFVTTRDIEAGEEMFVDVDDSWLRKKERELDDDDDHEAVMPTEDEYHAASEILNLLRKHLDDDKEDELSVDMLTGFKEIIGVFEKRIAALIPSTPSDILEILQHSSEEEEQQQQSMSISLAKWKLANRSIDWITENGKCLDNLIPKTSTLPKAGMGAFASRSIAKGSIIVPAPLLEIFDRNSFLMYDTEMTEDGYEVRSDEEIVGHQLLMNYCFGHQQSTLLLCPASNAILMNHCSERSGDDGVCDGPNAKIVWDTHWDAATASQVLAMTLNHLKESKSRILSFDVIALRDIQEGEEIFIDYGIEWEDAWNDHVTNWKPPDPFSPFASWESVTKIRNQPFRTEQELITNPYANNVLMGCIYWEEDDDEEEDDDTTLPNSDLPLSSDTDQLIQRFGEPGNHFTNDAFLLTPTYWPCTILQQQQQQQQQHSTFTVRIRQSPYESNTKWFLNSIPRILTDYPISSVRYFNEMYTSDQHLPNAFRYPIGIPDRMFPEQWKNLR